MAVARYEPDGQLDPTFGTDGITTATPWSAASIGVEPDGRIVVAGSADSGLAIMRLRPNGALDASFGSNGIVTMVPEASAGLGNSRCSPTGTSWSAARARASSRSCGSGSEARLTRASARTASRERRSASGRRREQWPFRPTAGTRGRLQFARERDALRRGPLPRGVAVDHRSRAHGRPVRNEDHARRAGR